MPTTCCAWSTAARLPSAPVSCSIYFRSVAPVPRMESVGPSGFAGDDDPGCDGGGHLTRAVERFEGGVLRFELPGLFEQARMVLDEAGGNPPGVEVRLLQERAVKRDGGLRAGKHELLQGTPAATDRRLA